MLQAYTITSDQPMNLDRFLTTESSEVSLDREALISEADHFCTQVEGFKMNKTYTIDLTKYGFGVQTLNDNDPLIKCIEEIKPKKATGIKLVSYADVSLEETKWAWKDFIPADAFTILAGEPERGKSTIAVELLSRITTGDLEGSFKGTPHNVLYLSDEDSAGVIAKRLMAAGADMKKVFSFTMDAGFGYDYAPTFPANVDALSDVIEDNQIKAVVLDSLSGFTGATLTSYDDRSIRTMLSPLRTLAEKHGCVFIGLMHFNKDTRGKSVISNIAGSAAFTRFARGVLAVDKDNKNDDSDKTHTLSSVKGSYLKDKANMQYTLTGVDVKLANGNTENIVRVVFEGRTSQSVEALQLMNQESDGQTDSQWLKEILTSSDGYMLGTDLNEKFKKEVAKDPSALSRCKKASGVFSARIENAYYNILLNPGETQQDAKERVKQALLCRPKTFVDQAVGR